MFTSRILPLRNTYCIDFLLPSFNVLKIRSARGFRPLLFELDTTYYIRLFPVSCLL